MNRLLQNLDRHYAERAGKTVLKYSLDGDYFTYAQLDEYTSRVYRYLKERNIGREDIVVIHVDRSIKIIALMVGIWRAGAAVVVCESSMSPERVRYIASDCACTLMIEEEECLEIGNAEPLNGRETVDNHDAAYIVYTSGSTGNPKGVIHEFGNIEEAICAKQLDGKAVVSEDDVVAINSPLNFVAAADYIVNSLNAGATILLMDTSQVKDNRRLPEIYEKEGVTGTFMTPSLYRTLPSLNTQLLWIILGGEPCSGIFNPKLKLINGYNLSEAGRDMCLFPIDKKYKITPIGHNRGCDEVLLLDENGRPAETGYVGEICFKNSFVRGYIGLPEKTAAAWRDGIFHTGDLASCDEDGEITLHGRSDDMIKINGNRIEPSEIESATKELLGLGWAAAKGFVTDSKAFVVVYYTDDVTFDSNEARTRLSERLPHYMLPSFFMKLNRAPMLPNGKLDRKNLPIPDIDNYRKEYVAPVTPLQEKLCHLFEEILGISKVGIDDDFYELGGDSLNSMMLVRESEEEYLSVDIIYKQRTIRKISLALEDISAMDEDALDEAVKAKDVKLNAFETYIFDYQLYAPDSTLCNMPQFWRMKVGEIDVDRLYDAIISVIEAHPVFKSIIRFNDELELVKHYDKNRNAEVTTEYVTEEEMERIIPELVTPFKLLNSSLYRFKIFITEKYVYLFMDMSHIFSDGTSLHIVERDISKAYYGEILQKDYFYLLSEWIYNRENGEEAKTAAEYNNERYGSHQWTQNVPVDHQVKGSHAGIRIASLDISRQDIDRFIAEKNITLNILAIAAALLTLRRFTNTEDIMVSWLHSGRDSNLYNNAVGLMIKELPAAVKFDEIKTIGQLLSSVKQQTIKGMEMCADPYIIRNTSIAQNDVFRIRNQGNLMRSTFIEGIAYETLQLQNDKEASSLMDMLIVEEENKEIETWIIFNDKMVDSFTAEKIQALYKQSISDIVSDII